MQVCFSNLLTGRLECCLMHPPPPPGGFSLSCGWSVIERDVTYLYMSVLPVSHLYISVIAIQMCVLLFGWMLWPLTGNFAHMWLKLELFGSNAVANKVFFYTRLIMLSCCNKWSTPMFPFLFSLILVGWVPGGRIHLSNSLLLPIGQHMRCGILESNLETGLQAAPDFVTWI